MKPRILMIGIILLSICTLNYSDKVQKAEKQITYLNIDKDIVITYDIQDELYKNLHGVTLEEKEVTKEPEWINIIATAYTASADECGNNLGITASGTQVSYSRGTIAAPVDIPFNTKISIPELNKVFIVEDRGSQKHIRRIDENTIRIDVYVKTKAEAKKFGVRYYKGYIIKE